MIRLLLFRGISLLDIVSDEASIELYRRRSSHFALWNDDDNDDDGDDAIAAVPSR